MMMRLNKIIKPWKDAAAFGDHINLYGFWNETAFLTKSGDVGMVLRVTGVDYESLDYGEQEYAVKRLEAALKNFGPGFHVHQYLFKTNHPEIPFADYDDDIVQTGQNRRREHFREKSDRLFEIEIYYAVAHYQDPAGSRLDLRCPPVLTHPPAHRAGWSSPDHCRAARQRRSSRC